MRLTDPAPQGSALLEHLPVRVSDEFEEQSPRCSHVHEPGTDPGLIAGERERFPQDLDAGFPQALHGDVKVVDVERHVVTTGIRRSRRLGMAIGGVVGQQFDDTAGYLHECDATDRSVRMASEVRDIRRGSGLVGPVTDENYGSKDLAEEADGLVEIWNGKADMIQTAQSSRLENHSTTLPPLTGTTVPVTCPERSLIRNSSADTRSAAWANRFID